jgi:hypothetical protein
MPADPAWLHDAIARRLGEEYATGFKEITDLGFYGDDVTNENLKCLRGLTHLQSLYICDARVTDAGLQNVAGNRHMRVLLLSETPITDTGLQSISGFTKLEWLLLDRTQVTDAGVQNFRSQIPKCSIDYLPTGPGSTVRR